MKNQCVTYEIAELLNQLGFDLPCYGFYHDNSEDNQKAGCAKKFVSMVGWVVGRETTNDLSSHDFIYVAPLWQQVIDWLYEVTEGDVYFTYDPSDLPETRNELLEQCIRRLKPELYPKLRR